MNIYAIRRDRYKYQELDLKINDFIDDFPEKYSYIEAHEFSRNNIELKPFWRLMRTGFSTIEGNENLIPDITPWIGATLLFSPKAYRFLGESLMTCGEFLPIQIDNDIFQIFNCLTLADVIENKSSESNLIFDEKSIGDKLIFKSKFQYCIDIYCTEKLKDAIFSFELKGVILDTHLGAFTE